MSVYKKICESVNSLYTKVLILGSTIMYRRSYNHLLRMHPNRNQSVKEDCFIRLWMPLQNNPHKQSFRLFSQYIGPNPNIVPEDISSCIIQPLLNPIETRPYYQDKNMFEKILPKEMLPKAILRRIKGEYYDAKYNPIHYNDEWFATKKISTNRIFLKPAIDSSSGEGVMCFSRNDDGCYYTKTGQKFDEAFLQLYSTEHSDFIVQEGLTQSMYMAQFNPSSINTLRIATYRSVVDNTVHVVRIIMRIGRSGSEVDNAHAGGLFVGIGMNGTVGKYACDQYGNKFDSFNGVDFSNSTFAIPNFANILDFAKDIGARILHHRLIAQDIAIQRDGTPCLVEFNIRAFSTWLFQFTTGPALGEYANEIIEYCAKHKKDVNKVLVEPF